MPTAYSVEGLMKWVRHEQWRDAFADLLNRHLVTACSGAEVNVKDLPALIGERVVDSTVARAAMEDASATPVRICT